ncbi:hypothetical protein BU16DRAFT_618600 [Lophium mytilinum]|uniref:Zn(2)-C6 fungal-type domain-containing protein n=1 Tax=Lophium mytilinum TaxID=390894 RepID=A0A6A6QUD6_9PEZI|nr:hypothetical protein BU16DRAFT_618600 [Lophium mytilinum]
MATGGSYPDPSDTQMSHSGGLYVHQNGAMSPAQHQQQQQHGPTDPELQLQENLQQHLGRHIASAPPQEHSLNPPHHQVHTPIRPTHSPQQMAQNGLMSLEDQGHYIDDGSGSRKRSKVSRACDECRRKKIRCDATSENGPEACSSCKRTGARCQFSRQPMKRGPSKGYIKELADRLNTLESQIGGNPSGTPQSSYDIPYGLGEQINALADIQTPTQYGRKRTHSMSEGLQDSYGPSHRPNMGWSAQETSTQRDQYSVNGAQGINFPHDSSEAVLKAYYILVHPTLPILPLDPAHLTRISSCPLSLRNAFHLALECAIQALSPSSLPRNEAGVPQLIQTAQGLLGKAETTLGDDDSVRQFYNNLVYIQSLLLLAFASDKSGPSAMSNTAELIARVVGRVSFVGLNDAKVLHSLREQDPDSFNTARRLFWVTFILDRFHASSMSTDLFMPLRRGKISKNDHQALGEVAYHLARTSNVIGQVAYSIRLTSIPNDDLEAPDTFPTLTPTSPELLFLEGQLDRLEESLDATNLSINSPPQLAFQYLRLIVARMSSSTAPGDVLALTRELLNNLTHGPISPLNHIFASLVATSLVEISIRSETQNEATIAIAEMDEAISNGQIVHRSSEGSGWDSSIRDLLRSKLPNEQPGSRSGSSVQPNMAGLQHLAAAAVGEREGTEPGARPVSSGGNAASTETKGDIAAAVAAASEAAAAQATAAAAQQQLQTSNTQDYDPRTLLKDGFMSALT